MSQFLSERVMEQAVELAGKLPDELVLKFLSHFFEVDKYLLEEFSDVLASFSQEDEEWVLGMVQQFKDKLAERDERERQCPFFALVQEDIEWVAQEMGVTLTDDQLEWLRDHFEVPYWAEVVETYIDLARE